MSDISVETLEDRYNALVRRNAELEQRLENRRIKDCINRAAQERLDSAEVIEVIRVELCRGRGTDDNLYRKVFVFYMPDGTYIGEIDPLA